MDYTAGLGIIYMALVSVDSRPSYSGDINTDNVTIVALIIHNVVDRGAYQQYII